MKKLKTLLCAVLVLCALSVPCSAGAIELPVAEPLATGSGGEITPMASKLTINKAITKRSESWNQDKGYTSYRVWVENTTSERMTVTITSPSTSDYHQYYVSANSSKTYTVNDAVSGIHTISFSTPSGDLSGTLRVRVSDVAL